MLSRTAAKRSLLCPTEFGCRILGGTEPTGTGPRAERRRKLFKEHIVGDTYTRQQVHIQQALRHHRRVVVTSGHSTGKSFVCADIAIWFLKAFGHRGLCKVITTAPTMRQVQGILWRTMRRRYSEARVPLGGRFLPKASRWEFGEEHFAEGLATDESERMQGYHSPYLLVILDEAAGVKENIWDAVRRLATGEMNFVLAIGNPGAPAGPFYEAAMNESSWYSIRLSSEDHPNVVTGEELIPGAATREWCDEMAEVYGGTSSMRYRAFIQGHFPTEGTDTLIAPAWVEAAMRSPPYVSGKPFTVVAADVARFGDDETVITVLKGHNHHKTIFYHGRDLMETSGIIAREADLHNRDTTKIIVDADGIGAGVVDRLRELRKPVVAFHGGLPPRYRPRNMKTDRRRERFKNLRSQAWYEASESLRTGEVTLKYDKLLKRQLSSLTYSFASDGTIQLERKEDLKDRLPLLGSPDRADSFVMGWWLMNNWDVDITPKKEKARRHWTEDAYESMGLRE